MLDLDFVGPPPLELPGKRGSINRVGLRRYKGLLRLDLRLWMEAGTRGTKQGVSLPAECLPKLIEYLNQLQNSACGGSL